MRVAPLSTVHKTSHTRAGGESNAWLITLFHPIPEPLTHLEHTACGMISPNTRMAVTDSRMAPTGLSRRSSSSGRASMQPALHNSSVHSNQCGLLTSPISRLAAARCFLVPAALSTCACSGGTAVVDAHASSICRLLHATHGCITSKMMQSSKHCWNRYNAIRIHTHARVRVTG